MRVMRSMVINSLKLFFFAVVCNAMLLAPAKALDCSSIPPETPIDIASQFGALPAQQWLEVANSYLFCSHQLPDPLPPGYSGIRDITGGWSGGTYDAKNKRLLIWGGGHAGYGGNEIYGFSTVTGVWSRLAEPSDNIVADTAEGFDGVADADGNGIGDQDGTKLGLYADNKPRAVHSHQYFTYVEALNSMLVVGSIAAYPGSTSYGLINLYDFDTNTWLNEGTQGASFAEQYPPFPAPANLRGGNALVDPATGNLWLSGADSGARLYSFDFARKKWTAHASYSIDHRYPTAAIDPVKRRLILMRGFSKDLNSDGDFADTVNGEVEENVAFWAFDLDNPDAPPVKPTMTAVPEALKKSLGPGLAYDPTSGLFVAWAGGGLVYTLDSSNDANWVWTEHPATSVTVPAPQPPSDGFNTPTYRRFSYVPHLNGFILMNSTEDNVFFCKLNNYPAAVVPNKPQAPSFSLVTG